MAFWNVIEIDVITDVDGNGRRRTQRVTGAIACIEYLKNDFADGAQITVTKERTGETIWSESNLGASVTRAPRGPVHSSIGEVLSGTDKIIVGNENIMVAVSGAGDMRSGRFFITIEQG